MFDVFGTVDQPLLGADGILDYRGYLALDGVRGVSHALNDELLELDEEEDELLELDELLDDDEPLELLELELDDDEDELLELDELDELDEDELLELDEPLDELDDELLEAPDELEDSLLLLDDELLALSSGARVISMQPSNCVTPAPAIPPVSKRRNALRSSLACARSRSRPGSEGRSLMSGTPRMNPRSIYASRNRGFKYSTAPPSKYHWIRRITSSAVIMSMQRGRLPTTSTQSSSGPSL